MDINQAIRLYQQSRRLLNQERLIRAIVETKRRSRYFKSIGDTDTSYALMKQVRFAEQVLYSDDDTNNSEEGSQT